ncbi:hypothetical protein VCHC17A1_3367B, partial [Vibrio cholerae HC-17A1]
SAADSGGFF